MSQSKLSSYTRLSPNCTSPRSGKIRGVAVHCTAGSPDNTAAQIVSGARFIKKSSSGASCHYAVGGDGSIAQGCLEENRAWCTSDTIDHEIVTIEVASDTRGIIVREAAVDALVKLLADICRRNGITRLLWEGDRNLMRNWARQNMVVHRWTANKACPGDTLYNRHGEIAKRVNAILKGDDEDMTEAQVRAVVREEIAGKIPAQETYNSVAECPDWARATVQKLIAGGGIKGELDGKLNLSYDLLRLFVVNDRLGVYG